MLVGLGQLCEIKPRCRGGSLLCDELGLIARFEARNELTRSFPGPFAEGPGILAFPTSWRRKILQEKFVAYGHYCEGYEIVHKPVALAWRQRSSSFLRARAAATLPCRAFVNNPH